eukprot:1428722-Rhodomonas_salina.3
MGPDSVGGGVREGGIRHALSPDCGYFPANSTDFSLIKQDLTNQPDFSLNQPDLSVAFGMRSAPINATSLQFD